MKIEKKYFYIGLSLAMLIILNQVVIQYFLFQMREDAKTINTAGRQRSLSQRVNLMAYRVCFSPETYSMPQLLLVVNKWEKAHIALTKGNAAMHIDPLLENETLKKAQVAFERITQIKKLINQSPKLDKETLRTINTNVELFLKEMERIVADIEHQSNKKLFTVIIIEITLALIGLAFIYFEFKKIIIPVLKKLIQNTDLIQSTNDILIESENKLRAIFDSTKDINLLIRHDYKVLNFNKMAYEIGLLNLKNEFKIGVDIRDYFFEEDLKLVETHLPRILQGEQFVFDIERIIDNKKVWFEVTYLPVYDSKDKILGCNINLKDITERTTNLEKIIRQNEVLKKIAWQQSHEVRQPLANILGLVDLIKIHKDDLNGEMRDEIIELLKVSTTKLDEIVRSIVQKTNNIDKE